MTVRLTKRILMPKGGREIKLNNVKGGAGE